MNTKRVIICGGGTAGHLFPALSVGKKLIEKCPEIQITYVGGTRELERKIMLRNQVDFIALKIEGIKGRGLRIVKSLLILPWSFLKSLGILMKIKSHLVIGVGGYSSGPIVLMASWMKIPTLILEQNRYPGLTNRLLLPWIKKAVVAFDSSLSDFKGKGIFLGNPVREEFYNISEKLRNGKLTLLVFGGSQGSHFLNQKIINSLTLLKKIKTELCIFHQTGEKDYEWVKRSYLQNQIKSVTVAPFFYDMAEYFEKSDLIISRAGASTIAELIAAQKASLLIPFAQATENHQTLNARELEKINAAEIILEKDFSEEFFAEKIQYYAENKEKITQMENNLKKLRTENAADKISELCLELMKTKNQEN